MNIKPNNLIRSMFLRNHQSHPIGCLAICVDRDNNSAQYQMSVLNPMDRFSRSLSRQLSIGRLIEQPITVKIPKDATMHDISTLIMHDIVVRAIAPSRAIKAAKLWLNNNVRSELERANILADFTDDLNAYGANSNEVKAFYRRFEGDDELVNLFDTAVKVKEQLQKGHAAYRDGTKVEVVNFPKLTSFEF